MRVTWFVCAAVCFLGAVCCVPVVCAEIAPPPAINVPSGGVVVTEINVSDDNVLGIIKQAIPTVAKLAAGLFTVRSQRRGDQGSGLGAPEMLIFNAFNFPEMMEALQGLKGLRIMIVQYPGARPTGKQFMEQFDKGVGKLGGFSKVLGDIAFFPGAAGIYAQPANAGYIAFTYDPKGGVMYAARTVGFVDLPKLLQTIEQVMAAFMTRAVVAPPPAGEQPEDGKSKSSSDTGD